MIPEFSIGYRGNTCRQLRCTAEHPVMGRLQVWRWLPDDCAPGVLVTACRHLADRLRMHVEREEARLAAA